jgi:hypothetical protein
VWLVTGELRLTNSFGVQVTTSLPDVTRSADVVRGGTTTRFSETFRGVGDTSVLAWHRHVTFTGWTVAVNAGASLPTGKTERPRFRSELEDDSLVPVSRLQRGSGTIDPLFGVSANRIVSSVWPPGIRAFVSAAARAPVAENEFGLRTGASWEVGAGAAREIRWHPFVGIVRMSWLHRNQDVFEGTPVLVGGGDWISIAPAAALQIGTMTVQAEIKWPLFRSTANRQLDAARSFQIGLTWAVF